MSVRAAVVDDVAALAEVHIRTWQAAYAGLVPQEHLDAMDPVQREPAWRQRLADVRPPAAILVWQSAETVVGFVSVQASRDPDVDPREIGEVTAIYLLPGHWGRGVGRRLMTAALEHLAGAGFRQATLWVLDTNVRARRFYEAAGWHPDGAVKSDDSRGFPLEQIRYRRELRPAADGG